MRVIDGGSLLALIGILNELSSVTKVIKSSKSAKLGALKAISMCKLIPGAMSPVTSLGNLNDLTVKFSVLGGMNLIRFATAETQGLIFSRDPRLARQCRPEVDH